MIFALYTYIVAHVSITIKSGREESTTMTTCPCERLNQGQTFFNMVI